MQKLVEKLGDQGEVGLVLVGEEGFVFEGLVLQGEVVDPRGEEVEREGERSRGVARNRIMRTVFKRILFGGLITVGPQFHERIIAVPASIEPAFLENLRHKVTLRKRVRPGLLETHPGLFQISVGLGVVSTMGAAAEDRARRVHPHSIAHFIRSKETHQRFRPILLF